MDDRDVLTAALRTARAAVRRGAREAAELLHDIERRARRIGDQELERNARVRQQMLEGNGAEALAAARLLVSHYPGSRQALSLAMEVCNGVRPAERPCEVHVVGSVAAFRRLAGELPQRTEAVLELGCANGRATARLARSCRVVYAVEKTAEMLQQAREWVGAAHNVHFLQFDVRQAEKVRVYLPEADLIMLDIGGSAPFWQVVELGQRYRALFGPRALVMRCVYLNDLIGSIASSEPPSGRGPWSRLTTKHR